MVSKRGLRITVAGLVVLSVLVAGYGLTAAATETRFESYLKEDGEVNREARITPKSDGITVVATDSNTWRGQRSKGPRAVAELITFDPNGTILYYNDSHTRYWDVDPVPGTAATVEYGYADHLEPEECPDWAEERRRHGVDERRWGEYLGAQDDVDACTRNGFERVNLTTGKVTHV